MLKNRATDEVLFVVLFTLYLKDDVNEDGSIKEGVVGGKPHAKTDGVETNGETEEHNVHETKTPVEETSADDVD